MANGNVVAIFIAPIAGGKMEEVEIAEAIAGAGLAGDRYSMAEGSFELKTAGQAASDFHQFHFLSRQWL